MKKIVALVLSLVMVLGLATTAFAAPDTYDFYQADATLAKNLAAGTPLTGWAGATIDEVAAKTNSDGSGNVAYLCANGFAYYVKTTAPTVADYAVTAHGKTEVLFYVSAIEQADASYAGTVKAFADFGTKCGQLYQVDKTLTYYEVVKSAVATAWLPGTVLVEVDPDTYAGAMTNVLAGDEVVVVASAKVADSKTLAVDKLVKHNWAITGVTYSTTLGMNVPTEAKCLNCGAVVTEFYYGAGKVPAGKLGVALDAPYAALYIVEPAAAAPAVDAPATDKVESAQTFDAGIAMYVGMSVMAAAGSAVVLKKKD